MIAAAGQIVARHPAGRGLSRALVLAVLLLGAATALGAQESGRIDCRIWTVAPGQALESRASAGAGVEVRLVRGGERVAAGETDGGGRVAFGGLAAGSYRLEVVRWPREVGPESATGGAAEVSLDAGGRQTVNIVLVFREGRSETSETREVGVPDPGEAMETVGRGVDEAKQTARRLWDERRPWVIGVVALLVALFLLRQLVRRGDRDLRTACARGIGSLGRFEKRLGPIDRADPDAVVDLFMAYRDSHAFDELFSLYSKMPAPLQQRLPVRQQYAFALNRAGRGDEAEGVLKSLLAERGPSPETCGILGRVYKDRWEKARGAGLGGQASEILEQAIDAYLAGHQADPSDPYPGINVLTLAEHSESRRGELRERFRREVSAAIESGGGSDEYWRQATRLELAMHLGREAEARGALQEVLKGAARPRIGCPQVWKVRTTLRNQRLIQQAREARGEPVPAWAREVVAALESATS